MSNYANGDFDSRYGTVHVRNPGPKNDPPYGNVRVYHQTDTRQVVLQAPALKAFKAAELRITPARMKRRGKVRHILLTGVGYRSYTYQEALYRSDSSGRYADPDGSMHVEADAVDIDQEHQEGLGLMSFKLARIRKALEAEGFHYAVEGEPWHASFRLPG